MARNRRHQSAAIRFGPALKAAALCALIGGSAVGFVWQKDQLRQLSEQIVQSERKLIELRTANDKLRRQLLDLRSPAQLERLIGELHLDLRRPAPDQVLRLPEPTPGSVTGPGEYAAGRADGAWP